MGETTGLLTAEARIPAAAAHRYLTQLCKHFAHRLTVTLEERHGRIEFADGLCELDAAPAADALILRVIAADEASLVRLEDVVARHLERFAFREALEVRWTRA